MAETELGPEAVAHIARIARLALDDAERARLATEANGILRHFEAVLSAVGPEAGEPSGLAARADEVRAPDPAEVEAIVAQFPRKDGRFAKAPGGL